MRILVITPQFPYPPTGACEQDRLVGFKLLQEIGHDISVLAKVSKNNLEKAQVGAKSLGFEVCELVPYRDTKPLVPRLCNPLFLDGAAYEYTDPVLQEKLIEMLDAQPYDLVWCEYTYLWPVYREIKKRNIPIVVRSINVEPEHFLEEDGFSLVNYIKSRIKWMSEIRSVKGADHVSAITPKEEKVYAKLGVVSHNTIPLRALHTFLGTHVVKDKSIIDIVFMGSTYQVSHNKSAAEKIIKEIAPALEKKFPNMFRIHITGAKLPKDLANVLPDNVVYEGYVDDLDQFLENIDIALVPSLFGQGMQQKVFEPIVRGIPTITTTRAIAGYDLVSGREYIHAESLDDYLGAIERLIDVSVRREISLQAVSKSRVLFAKSSMLESIQQALTGALKNNEKNT